jgi:exonuclease VII small subunit
MPRLHRTSRILEKGQLRILKLKSIDLYLSVGKDCDVVTLERQIEDLNTKLNDYNSSLAALDVTKQEIEQMEKKMGDLLDQLLQGVATKYGNDSREYEMAGGTRKSDRIRKSAQARTKTNAAKKLMNAQNN